MKLSIDLNCDLGESFGYQLADKDDLLMDYVSSINIACGFHAGEPAVMHRTILTAKAKNVAIGAHPGLPDLQGFGRRNMHISPKEAYQITLYQLGALYAFVRAADTVLHHVKPHGALYNMAAIDLDLALGITQAVFDFDPKLILYAPYGSRLEDAAHQLGLPVMKEAFADRRYSANGMLLPRNQNDALINDIDEAIIQAVNIVKENQVYSAEGKPVKLVADTICIHGDGEKALAFARTITEKFTLAGIAIHADSNER